MLHNFLFLKKCQLLVGNEELEELIKITFLKHPVEFLVLCEVVFNQVVEITWKINIRIFLRLIGLVLGNHRAVILLHQHVRFMGSLLGWTHLYFFFKRMILFIVLWTHWENICCELLIWQGRHNFCNFWVVNEILHDFQCFTLAAHGLDPFPKPLNFFPLRSLQTCDESPFPLFKFRFDHFLE